LGEIAVIGHVSIQQIDATTVGAAVAVLEESANVPLRGE